MVQIFKKNNFVIYSTGGKHSEFIVHNKRKEFANGHTHINNFNTAKYIIYMSSKKIIPKKKISNYLLESIIRVSDNKAYIKRLTNILNINILEK